MAGVRMHTPHPSPLDPPPAISFRSHHKSMAYFSRLAPLVLFFFIKRYSQMGGPWHNAPPNYAPVLLYYAKACIEKRGFLFAAERWGRGKTASKKTSQ